MKTAIKQISENIDLYGTEVLMYALINKFTHVSFTRNCKTIPTEGSNCKKTHTIRLHENLKVEKVIFHKSGAVTVRTDEKLFFQFLNLAHETPKTDAPHL